MKINRLNFNFLIVAISVFASSLNCYERITSFHADITVQQDGSLLVTETIKAFATGQNIKRGLYRDFPTVYWQHYSRSQVEFIPFKVLLDGEELPTIEVQNIEGGKRVFMRGQHLLEVPQEHIFELTYATTRQLGFFNNHDELYWNVVGGDWRFAIMNASAYIHFPENLTINKIDEISVYAGDLGNTNKGEDALIEKRADNSVVIKYLGVIRPGQAFTFVITWPKGFVQEPSWWQKKLWLLQDNIDLVLAFLLILSALMLIFIAHYRLRKRIIIPLFTPPLAFEPGMICYFNSRHVDALGLSADIVACAVKGHIKIESTWKWFRRFKTVYTLITTYHECHDSYYKKLLRTLGAKRVLDESSQKTIIALMADRKLLFEKTIGKPFFYSVMPWFLVWVGMVLFTMTLLCGMFIHSFDYGMFVFVFCGSAALSLWLVYHFVRFYTPEGLKIYDQIQGFKRFLSVTEKERLKFITTPPTKTPELYEQMLPYAMALGVEKLWTKQFTPVFEAMKAQGRTYIPIWYSGSPFHINNFSSSLSRSLSSSISSVAPGSSSGSDAGGSSGGGGGGGGGGGC